MTTYVYNSMGPPSCGNTTINRTVLHEMERNFRQAVVVSVGDNCGDNKNCANFALKPQFLVDQSMRLFDVSVLLLQRHAKEDADRRFGSYWKLERRACLFSEDCVALLAGKVPLRRTENGLSGDRPRVFDPTKFSHLDRALLTAYRGPFPPCFGEKGN
jgi:hypothetical protein